MIDVLPAGSFQVEGADSDAECLVLVNSKEANSVMAEEDIRGLFEQIKVDAEFVDLPRRRFLIIRDTTTSCLPWWIPAFWDRRPMKF